MLRDVFDVSFRHFIQSFRIIIIRFKIRFYLLISQLPFRNFHQSIRPIRFRCRVLFPVAGILDARVAVRKAVHCVGMLFLAASQHLFPTGIRVMMHFTFCCIRSAALTHSRIRDFRISISVDSRIIRCGIASHAKILVHAIICRIIFGNAQILFLPFCITTGIIFCRGIALIRMLVFFQTAISLIGACAAFASISVFCKRCRALGRADEHTAHHCQCQRKRGSAFGRAPAVVVFSLQFLQHLLHSFFHHWNLPVRHLLPNIIKIKPFPCFL